MFVVVGRLRCLLVMLELERSHFFFVTLRHIQNFPTTTNSANEVGIALEIRLSSL